MKEYREKDVQGFVNIINPRRIITSRKETITVRMTQDKNGASLSLQARNIMFLIPLEEVKDIISISERSNT